MKRMKTIWIIYFFVSIAAISYMFYKCVWKHKCNVTKKGSPDDNNNVSDHNNIDKEDMKFTLELVNSWINNCDQKASILLSIIGVAITLMLTSDFIKFLRNYIFEPFVLYISAKGKFQFSLGRFTVFFLLLIAACTLAMACYYLFRAIKANIDYKKLVDENPSLEKTSRIFFGAISKISYEEFKKVAIKQEEDLRSQIYVNSKIATEKYNNYNKGLSWFKVALFTACLLFLAVMLMQ